METVYGLTMWEFFIGSGLIACTMAVSFIIFGALTGIFAWLQLGVNIMNIKKRAKSLDQSEFLTYWEASGIVIWKKLQK